MDEPPYCPKCGQEMRLAVSLLAEGGLPAVEGFRCDNRNEEITREVE
jgi:hypothetical protein